MKYILSFFIFILFTSSLSAQDQVQTGSDSAMVNELKPLEVNQIAVKASELKIEILQKRKDLIDSARMATYRADTDSLQKEINFLKTKSNLDSLPNFSMRRLGELQREWKRQESRVLDLQSGLSDETANINEELSDLETKKTIWELTSESSTEKRLARPILLRVNSTIKSLDSLIKLEDKQLTKLLLILDQVTQMNISCNSYQDEIGSYQVGRDNFIMQNRYQDILSKILHNEDSGRVRAEVRQFVNDNQQVLGDYYQEKSSSVYEYLLIILINLLIIIWLRKKIVNQQDGEDELPRFLIIFQNLSKNAFAAALLVSFVFYPFFFKNPPIIWVELVVFGLLMPALVMISWHLRAKVRVILILLILAIFLNQLHNILPGELLTTRLSSLVSGGLILIIIIKFYQEIKKADLKKNLYQLLYFASALIGVINVLGIIANMVGYIVIGDLFIKGSNSAVFIGIITLAAGSYFLSLFYFLIRSKATRSIQTFAPEEKQVQSSFYRFFMVFLILFWMFFTLRSFNLDDVVIEFVSNVLNYSLSIGTASLSMGNILGFLFTIWISFFISRIIRNLLEKDILPQFRMEKGLPYTISMLVGYAIVSIGFFLAIAAAGIELSQITVILGAFSVGIGFGLQNIFNNLVSGLIMAFERPLKIGDTIQVSNMVGIVKSIGIRSSNIRTFDGAEVIVPNGNLISNEVINWTLSDLKRRIEVLVGVSYGADPNTVKDILMKEIKDHPDVIDFPSPMVLFVEFGDSSLNFRMLFWTPNFNDWLRVQSEMYFNVFYALKAAGIEIPFPQRDINLRTPLELRNLQNINMDDEKKPVVSSPQKPQTKEINEQHDPGLVDTEGDQEGTDNSDD